MKLITEGVITTQSNRMKFRLSAKTKIFFFHDDEFTCISTWIFVSFSQLSVQKSTAMIKNFLVLFWD